MNNKNYSVVLGIDEEEEEKVISVTCEDCAGSAGMWFFFMYLLLFLKLPWQKEKNDFFIQSACKHSLACLMWIHHRSENPPPTEVECYWKNPLMKNIGSF